MKSLTILFLGNLSLLFLAAICGPEEPLPTQEEELAFLDSYRQEIEDMAITSICNATTECRFIAFGSKACGGPQSYLIYSTSINTETLESLVEDYNNQEAQYNERWEVVSDCATIPSPVGFDCIDQTCIAIY